jgi:hypothetical protein
VSSEVRDPERAERLRNITIWASVAIVVTILLIPITHDLLVVASENSKEEAWWKNQTGLSLDPPWREAMFANNERERFTLSIDDVELDDAGTYLVPTWVERLEADGRWTRRKCIARWRRDGFNDWRLESRRIEGEPEQRLDLKYPTTMWQSHRLWLP